MKSLKCFFIILLAFLFCMPSIVFCTPVKECEIAVPGYPHAPVVGDVDADRRPEIVVGYGATSLSSDQGGLIVLRKHPNNRVDTVFNWSIDTGNVYTPYIGDVDGDNLPEICVQFTRPGADDSIIVFNHDFTVLWRAFVGSGTGPLTVEGGHAITAGDMEGDGTIEVFASETRSNYIRVFDGRTGRLIRDILDSDGYHPYGAATLWNLDEVGAPEIVSCFHSGAYFKVCAFHTDDGSEYWCVQKAMSYGVANLKGDSHPEVVLERYSEHYLNVNLYDFDGTFYRTLKRFELPSFFFGHFSLPVIADFDSSTPTPEVVVAINHVTSLGGIPLIACYRADSTEFWRYLILRFTEFTAITAADLNCDLIPEIAALSCYSGTTLVIIDGATGVPLGTFDGPVPIHNQDNNMVAICDVDGDSYTELIYGGRLAFWDSFFVAVVGNDGQWSPTRSIWNEGGFYYTSTGDNLDLRHRSYTNWLDENLFRCQKPIPCGLIVAIHDTLGCIRCGHFSALRIHAAVMNLDSLPSAPNIRVRLSFLHGGGCLRLTTGSYEYFLGTISPNDTCNFRWVFSVDDYCPHRYIIVRITVWSSDSAFDSVIVDRQINFPDCYDFPEVRITKPTPCGGVMTCANSIQQMIEFYVEPRRYPIVFDSVIVVVNSDTYTLESSSLLTDRRNNIVFIPSPPFSNGDTVTFQLARIMSEMFYCPYNTPPCSVIVDLQPPILFEPQPVEGERVCFAPSEFRVRVIDSIAGVNWSSVDSAVAHITTIFDTVEIGITHHGDTLIIPLSGVNQAGTVSVCITGIEDAPTIRYCPPNIVDTCFHYVVLGKSVPPIILPERLLRIISSSFIFPGPKPSKHFRKKTEHKIQ